jgi:hypothetical protein
MMLKLNSFWGWFVVIIVLFVVSGTQLYFRNNVEAFDLTKLQDNEVLFFAHTTHENNIYTKLKTLKSLGEADVILLGSHQIRALYDVREKPPYTSINMVYGNTGLNGSLDLLKTLKKKNLLPRRLAVISLLTHGDLAREIDTKFYLEADIGLARNIVRWWGRIPLYLTLNHMVPGLASYPEKDLVFDYELCETAFRARDSKPAEIMTKLRFAVGRFLPVYFNLKSGLLSLEEVCQHERMFQDIDFDSFTNQGGYPAKYQRSFRYTLNIRKPYNYAIHSDEILRKKVDDAVTKIKELNAFSRQHGFKVMFLFAPRYEKPLNSHLDEVANRVFEQNKSFIVADFRRNSLDKTLFYDDTHPGRKFGPMLYSCIDKVMRDVHQDQSFPALEGRGNTYC